MPWMVTLRTRLSRSVLFTAVLVLLAATTGLATVVTHADLTKLTQLADVIVDATVESQRTEFEPAQGAIWTVYELRVTETLTETLAGTERKTLSIHVPGGTTAGLTQEISGAVRLDVGERAVFFLTKEEDRLLVLGQSQGCFRVTRRAVKRAASSPTKARAKTRTKTEPEAATSDADGAAALAKTDELVCRNDLTGLALVADDGKGVTAEPIELTLTALRAKIKTALDEKAAIAQRRRAETDRRLAALRKRARRNRERLRGKPGGGE